MSDRVRQLFNAQQRDLRERTDRMFAWLMPLQWLAGIAAAALISPRTWAGVESETHVHLWAAILLGGALAFYPVWLALTRPGQWLTRHSIAVSQMLVSALLIHLCGGRIETHFHIFGSLAFLAFYRDRQVLLTAATVVVIDHLARGIFWPESVYGVANAPLWRTMEHAGWVVFEMVFLLVAVRKATQEMWATANRQHRIEASHDMVEKQVQERTAALRFAEQRTRAILDTAADGIITIDHKGIVQTFNPAAEQIFGYTAAEIIGRNVTALMPSPYADEHDGYLRAYLQTGERKVIGVGREVVGKRKDESTFPLDLAVSESTDGIFTGIVRDITERKSVERMKTEFISTVSHELRTPLTSIRGSLGLIQGGAAGELTDKARSLIEIANNNSDRLVRLVNDILDIEKIEAGKMDFRMQRQDLMAVVQEAIAANDAFAQHHGVGIALDGSVPGAAVMADKDRLLQVLTNLISNAAKFSPKDDNVRVAVAQKGESLRVSVSDHGPGIPPEFHDRIFGKFNQADSSDVRQKDGTGLGLAISKALVLMHSGQIAFESTPGEGTTFYFDLPALPVHEPSTTDDSDTGTNGHRILICEDDADIAKLLGMMLKEAGFDSDIAPDASAARELLSTRLYDAMTLDLMLPGESGIELLRSLREQPAHASLPVIVVSAKASEGRQELQRDKLGVINWLAKPIDEKALMSSIEVAVRRHPTRGPGHTPLVLHVEDNDDLARVVAETLKSLADVKQARDITEARALLELHDFDVVLLDMELPDGSGLDLVPLLGRPGSRIPTVIFSANETASNLADHVVASFVKSRTSESELIDTITRLIHENTSPFGQAQETAS